jgi:AcrR family transcriptional regulator
VARTVDPDSQARRRAQLVDAVFRVVARDGIEAVSVRAVAREAGLSMGSLRHYFATQAELLAFSLGEVERRIRARLAGLDTAGDPREVLERVLHQLVPLSPASRVEHEIWLAFVGKAVTEPALHELNARVYDELRDLIHRLVLDALGPGPDADLETERVYALVDGLVLHAALRPGHWTPDRLKTVIRYHLDGFPVRPRPPRPRRRRAG